MGRTKRLGKKLRPLLSWAAAAVLLAGMSRLPVDWGGLMGRTAAVSAMLMLPEGGAAVVLDRLFPAEEKEDEPAFPDALPVYEYSFTPPEEEVLPAQKEETALPQEEAIPQRESIPEEYRGTVTEVTYTAQAGDGYIPLAAGYLKNSTALSDEQVREVLAESPALRLESTDSPQVLIVHTHATEAFAPYAGDFCDLREDWRSQDNGENVVLLGEIMAQELEKAGIGVIHDETQHDYPSYNGSYERSAETIRGYLEEYPGIRVVIDLHRDAIENPAGNLIRPVAQVDGKKAAQVMIIAGCDDGTMDLPGWRENLRWAAALQSRIETDFPGLTRPVFFCHRKYNMDLTGGSLLIEFGSHGNTLAQAALSARCVGQSMAAALQELSKEG